MEHPFSPGDMIAPDPWPSRALALLRTARDLEDGIAQSLDAWRGAVAFAVLRRGERNTVLRARVAPAGGVAETVVLKLAGRDALLADADLRHMQALAGSGVAPEVLAELADARGFAMSDHGDDTLARALTSGTPREVRVGVTLAARAYARLHVEGRARVGRTEALRSSALTRELGDWTDGLARALAWLQLTEDDSRVRRALTRVIQAWYPPRDAVTLTHGDPAPSNVLLLADGSARLVDFEYGAARHPYYDIAAWDVICPLPEPLVQLFRITYDEARAELGWPSPVPDGDYAPFLAHRALALLSWLPASARLHDMPWVESWTARQAVLCTLDRLAARAMGDMELQRLAEAAADAAVVWRRAWPEVEEVLPPWPAVDGPTA